ncbi:hypothetical protein CB1_000571005 [Camelus ferus]|nr:hypothetical protein CB1_000571005 [Camelus ferus]
MASGLLLREIKEKWCCDHANDGPPDVNAAGKHDGPPDTTDEPSFVGHSRNDGKYWVMIRSSQERVLIFEDVLHQGED